MKKIVLVVGLIMGSMLVSDAYASISVNPTETTVVSKDKIKKKKKAKKACSTAEASKGCSGTTSSCCKKKAAAAPEVAPGK